MTCSPPGHVQQLTTQAACLDVFSHVVEHIFLLQQDNVICQALLDLWGESSNLCTIYTLLMVPLETLTITYGRTSNARPLSNAYKNQIAQFQDMYDHCNSQTAWSDYNIFDLTSSYFDSYCFSISHNHDWLCPSAPIMTPHLCSHMLSNPSDLTKMFQWWGGVWSSHQSWTPFSGTTLHSWWDIWCTCQFWPDTHSWSWLCTRKWCVHLHGHRRTSWRGH
jgi:hypothetical protein